MKLHIATTGELYSFREDDAPLQDRLAVFSAQRYGSGPDAVLITYGIQGAGYFTGIREHFETIGNGVKCVMGFVWPRHVPLYKRAMKGLATVEVLFSGHPYGEDGPLMDWIIIWNRRE